jgi:hypothetical protein
MSDTTAIDTFLASLGLTADSPIPIPSVVSWENVVASPMEPPLPPLSRNPRATDDDIPLPPPPPSRLTRSSHFSLSTPEPGLELHRLAAPGSPIATPYGVKKLNSEFYVFTLSDISPLRSDRYVGKAIRGGDGDGPLVGIDSSVPHPLTGHLLHDPRILITSS